MSKNIDDNVREKIEAIFNMVAKEKPTYVRNKIDAIFMLNSKNGDKEANCRREIIKDFVETASDSMDRNSELRPYLFTLELILNGTKADEESRTFVESIRHNLSRKFH